MFRCKCGRQLCCGTWEYINNAWVAVITVCAFQQLSPTLLALGVGDFNAAFGPDFD